MRLGQLARKLAISPTAIVEFLEQRNIQLEAGTNTKLDATVVLEITKTFAPDLVGEILRSPASEGDPTKSEGAEEPEVIVDEKLSIPAPEVSTLENSSSEVVEPNDESTEVIKAPKVELQGLKVIGKIDLPEPRTKAPTEEVESPREENAVDKDRTPVNRKNSFQKPDRREQWQRQKARQRQDEDQEKAKQRKIEAERIKEQRTQNYLKKVKSGPTKAARRMEEQVIEMTEEISEQPKTWWGRFVRWLTT